MASSEALRNGDSLLLSRRLLLGEDYDEEHGLIVFVTAAWCYTEHLTLLAPGLFAPAAFEKGRRVLVTCDVGEGESHAASAALIEAGWRPAPRAASEECAALLSALHVLELPALILLEGTTTIASDDPFLDIYEAARKCLLDRAAARASTVASAAAPAAAAVAATAAVAAAVARAGDGGEAHPGDDDDRETADGACIAERQVAKKRHAEGIALHDAGDAAGALRCFAHAAALDPLHASASFNCGVLLQQFGLPLLAVGYVARAAELDPTDATAHAVLGAVLFDAEPAAVVDAYRGIVRRHPGNARAAHQLAVLAGEGAAVRGASAAYVTAVFDGLADSFEEKLVDHLHYKVPWQLLGAVRAICDENAAGGAWRVIDLGCGTGLCGRLFAGYASDPVRGGAIVGVDLSPKMVAKAAATGAYADVLTGDVHAALAAEAQGEVDLVLSADTFIYVGELERCFTLCAAALRDGGVFAFSVEDLPEKECGEYHLLRSGRYAHSRAYVYRLARQIGFEVTAATAVAIRNEQCSPVAGHVFTLVRRPR
ncbi:unnamed protein product [Phaeothamnion confervicola]